MFNSLAMQKHHQGPGKLGSGTALAVIENQISDFLVSFPAH